MVYAAPRCMTISFDQKPFMSGKVVSDRRASGLTMAGLAAYVILIVLLMIYFGMR
jgi:hypothetical protein